MNIAINAEKDEEGFLDNALVDSLVNRPRGEGVGIFRFYLCHDEGKVKAEATSRRAEYGYMMYVRLEKKLDTKSYKRSIDICSVPSTVTLSLSMGTVFAALMKIYGGRLLADYATEDELFDPPGAPGGEAREEAAVQAKGLYIEWLKSGSTFRFKYQFQDRDEEETDVISSRTDVFPVEGPVAVYMSTIGLYGAVVMCGDERGGLFLPLSYGYGIPCHAVSMVAPAIMVNISGLLALQTSGVMTFFPRKATAIVGYCRVVIASAWILRLICRRPQVLCYIIPFLVIGSLVLCPVFMDARGFFPGLDQVGGLSPSWYYLQIFK